MLPFFAWKIFSISFFISLDFYLGGNGTGIFHRFNGTSHQREDYDGRVYQEPV